MATPCFDKTEICCSCTCASSDPVCGILIALCKIDLAVAYPSTVHFCLFSGSMEAKSVHAEKPSVARACRKGNVMTLSSLTGQACFEEELAASSCCAAVSSQEGSGLAANSAAGSEHVSFLRLPCLCLPISSHSDENKGDGSKANTSNFTIRTCIYMFV